MSQNKKGFLHPFINYLIESKQLEIIIEEYSTESEEIVAATD
ncbi:hypothetical protein [Spiroplasma sp. AdecLV25b]|nr:hypothetical protein [Spiroplasma sp. AdecLV25b]